MSLTEADKFAALQAKRQRETEIAELARELYVAGMHTDEPISVKGAFHWAEEFIDEKNRRRDEIK